MWKMDMFIYLLVVNAVTIPGIGAPVQLEKSYVQKAYKRGDLK